MPLNFRNPFRNPFRIPFRNPFKSIFNRNSRRVLPEDIINSGQEEESKREEELQQLYNRQLRQLSEKQINFLKNLKNGILFKFFENRDVAFKINLIFTTLHGFLTLRRLFGQDSIRENIAFLMECKNYDNYYKNLLRLLATQENNSEESIQAFNEFINISLYFNILMLKLMMYPKTFLIVLLTNIYNDQEIDRIYLELEPDLTDREQVQKTTAYKNYLAEKTDFNIIQNLRISLRYHTINSQAYINLNQLLQEQLTSYRQKYGIEFKTSLIEDLYDYEEYLKEQLNNPYKTQEEKANIKRIYTRIIEDLKRLIQNEIRIGGNKKIIKKLKKYNLK